MADSPVGGHGTAPPESGRSPPVDTDGLAPPTVARELLVATRTGDDPTPYLDALAAFDEADLRSVRGNRETALAFWINCYNAGTQLLLDRRPGLYESSLRVVRFFRARALTVAGTHLSLNDIEDGLLRAGRSKYTMGYTPSILRTSFEQRYAVSPLDGRVHFALNCGAASCPAIRTYEQDAVDDQLDLATRTYLQQTVEYDAESGVARIPRLFLWYRGDFGGGRGIRSFLREYGAIPAEATPTLRHRSWDWNRDAGTFAD